jgi:hypothetical protein
MAITNLKNRSHRPEAGFTLLIAAIFMSVMLSFGITLASLGYKQLVLASLAIESQYAFFAANSALECALWADLQLHRFPTDAGPPASAPVMTCDGANAIFPTDFPNGIVSSSADVWVILERFRLDDNKHCAEVLIRKFPPIIDALGNQTDAEKTHIFSQGYNVPCDTVVSPNGARFVSRGLNTNY